jgi:hypothetical protein
MKLIHLLFEISVHAADLLDHRLRENLPGGREARDLRHFANPTGGGVPLQVPVGLW